MFIHRRNKFSAYKAVRYCVVLLVLCFHIPASSMAQETVSADKSAAAISQTPEEYSAKVKELVDFLEGRTNSFVYDRVGRPDPFMPFIKEKVVTSDLEAPEQELSGMRKFEPGQLTLVAVVLMQDGPLAMVEDSLGRGYIIKNGSEIGRTGVVDSITRNTVVVKQRYTTTAGEEHYKFLEMLLKKEGEKQQ